MSVRQAVRIRARDLGPVFIVAVAVALVSTLVGSVLDRVHQVDAEDLNVREYAAVPGPDSTQVLTIQEWGVRLTLPLAKAMPTVTFAPQSASSVGLSSADLAALGPACRASRNGLGAFVRLPAGSYSDATKGDPAYTYIATLAGHDYAYLTPSAGCASISGSGYYLNQEQSIVLGSLETLSPL